MSHPSQLNVMKMFSENNHQLIAKSDVLEIGSFDVNGTTRGFLKSKSYMGIDLSDGPGVDRVCKVEELEILGLSFDLIVSCEVFEHDPGWQQTLTSAYQILRPGGLLLITCASRGRPEHGTQRTNPAHSPGTSEIGQDYYGNVTFEEMEACISTLPEGVFSRVVYSQMHFDLVAFISKPRTPSNSSDENDLSWRIPSIKSITKSLKKVLVSEYIATRPLVPLSVLMSEENYQNIAVKYVKALNYLFLRNTK